MSPQLFHVVTAIVFLLATSHAGNHHEGIQRIPGKPGLNKMPVKEGKPCLKALPGLQAGPPEPPSSMRGPSGKDGLRGPQGPSGERDEKGEQGQPGQPGLPVSRDPELEETLKGFKNQIARLEGVLAMDGTIKTFGKKMFATNGQEVDFETTLEACKQAGGSIASPRNKGENDAVFSIVRLFNRYAYLGIKGGGIPGKFNFLDGTAVNYTNWHAGEPSDIGKENCMEMCTNGAWNGTSCNQSRLTICEF
ncbi:pulmonary surfactant-associated protein A1-like isoform X1 [Trachemys scripta elegans]|uniref:pulmonary surfactant-associated protein A1-like isoform X1 n=1 Tax=Trachemys scripta elegans TaxID=31138 RepID=UPI001551BFB5|nr:pulmonary surfactant-associated protein A1-like isoform X1 [Trachemys scripta elegans]